MDSDFLAAIVRHDLENVCRLLQESPEIVNVCSESGDKDAPLHSAAAYGFTDIARFLLDAGADIEIRDGGGASPLMMAAMRHQPKMVAFLVARGADVNARDNCGSTALHYSTSDSRIPAFPGIEREEDKEEEAALLETMSLLLSYGVDVNSRNENGFTPLHYMKNLAGIRLLLSHGADINAQDARGRTPLHLAAYERQYDVAELLVASGADIHLKDNRGRTALHYAVFDHDYGQSVELLLRAGADPNTRDIEQRTPLHQAVGSHCLEGVPLLIAAGADVNAKDIDLKTPLKFAMSGPYLGEDGDYVAAPWGEGDTVQFLEDAETIRQWLEQAGGRM